MGRDGGASRMAFGRSIWVYGDTVLDGADSKGESWHTNSWDHIEAAPGALGPFSFRPDAVGAPAYLVELTRDEIAFNEKHRGDGCAEPPCNVRFALWPGPPVWDRARQRAWIFYGLFNDAAPSGIGIALWERFEEAPKRREGRLFSREEPEYAIAPQVIDDQLHAFACMHHGKPAPCPLGRAPLEAADQRSKWTFWDGQTWVSDWSRAAPLFEGAPILEVSRAPALGGWLAIYAPPFSHEIRARTAPELTGRWSDEAVLTTLDEKDAPYDVLHHAELASPDGTVQYLTYSRPTGGWFASEHVALRVTLSRR